MKKLKIDISNINWGDMVYYDEASPSCLSRSQEWRSGRNNCILRGSIGSQAGSLNKNSGYYALHVGGVIYQCHRIIYEIMHGNLGVMEVDHIDGNRGNNKIYNLRKVSKSTNSKNKVMYKNNTSGASGVYYSNRGNCWVAQWYTLDGKGKKSKSFSVDLPDALELAIAYRNSMIEDLNQCGAGYTERHGI